MLRSPRLVAFALASLALVPLLPAPFDPVGEARADHCQPKVQDLTTGGNVITGTQDAVGAADAQWQLVFGPGGLGAGPVYAINPHPAWVPPTATSRWVNPWDQAFPNNAGPGGTPAAPTSINSAGVSTDLPYRYEVQFFLSNVNVDYYELDFRFAADDVARVYLNGAPTPIATIGAVTTTAGFAAWHPVYHVGTPGIPNGFVAGGMNTLTIEVDNWIFFTGLILEGTVTMGCFTDCRLHHDRLDTGVPGVPGLPDPRWRATQIASTPVAPVPPIAVPPFLTAWVPAPAGTSWVTTHGTALTATAAPAGNWTYEITFVVPCVPHDCTRIHVEFDFAADNHVFFALNGAPFTPTYVNAFGSLTHVDQDGCTGLFLPGLNKLEAHVTNAGSVTGLLVAGGYYVF